MKVRKGDTVIVIAGKDRGKEGAVVRAFPKTERVLIEGINVVKKHQRPKRQGQRGQVVEKPLPLHVSNVALKDPKTGKPTRVGYSMDDSKKVRMAKKSGMKIS